MKILHTADWHIGNFPGPEKDGENCRLKDTLLCIDELIRVAEQERPDLVLISGDIFHQARVWSDRGLSETQLAIGKIQALANVAPVVAMRGTPNHDGEEQFSALSQFFKSAPTRHPVFVAMEPDVLNIPTPHGVAQVATVPGFDRGFFRARFPGISREDECQIFTENLGKIVLTLRARMDTEGTTKVLMAHYMVPGCNMESGQAQFFSGVDPIILPETIDGAQYDLIALGHIHRPQQLETCHNAFYSGAVNALNFNDEGQERGFYLHNTDTGEHTFFPTPYRRFLTYDWTDCEITAILNGDIDDVAYHNWKWKADQPAIIDGAVVRVLYECSAEKDKAFNRALVERRLYEDGAFWVAGISPSNITADVSRKELSEQTAPEGNLREYLELKTYPEDEIGRIIEVARPIIARAIASSTNTRLAGVFTPISIEVKNYRNYAEESFDFTGITFCTINGKNGAGIWDAIKNVGSSIVNGFKDFFGIHSPSTLARDMIGANIGAGIAEGITDSTAEVEDSVNALGRAVSDTMDTEINPQVPKVPTTPEPPEKPEGPSGGGGNDGDGGGGGTLNNDTGGAGRPPTGGGASTGGGKQMYSPSQTMQRDLTPFCRPFIAVPVRKIK